LTASNGEMLTYHSSNPSVATVVNNDQIRIIGAGTATITASLPANPNYTGPLSESQTLTVRKAQQNITLDAPATLARDAGRVAIQVQSSAGLPVTLSVDDPMVATVEGTDLLVHRLGTVTITATQAGDTNHEAAPSVTHTIRVTHSSSSVADPASAIPIRVHPAVSPNGDGINDELIIEGIRDYPNNNVKVFDRNGIMLWEGVGYDNQRVAFSGMSKGKKQLPAGTYF